jgi:uncharacterized protein YkwD
MSREKKPTVTLFRFTMKIRLFFFLVLLTANQTMAQPWTNGERDAASTASEINGLSEEEKNAFMYLNLARMHPRRFAQNELRQYLGADRYKNPKELNSYELSLKKTLLEMSPMPPLKFSRRMYELAKCFSNESKILGTVGHTRSNCKGGYLGECCSYGPETGWGIILLLLVDDGIESLGHREICLDKNYVGLGVSINEHPKFGKCCVLDFCY